MCKRSLLFIFCYLSFAGVFGRSLQQDTASGMTPQHTGSAIVINNRAINELLTVDAMQTPGIKQFGPQSQLNAKRFWLTGFGGSQKICWRIHTPKAGAYRVVLLINAHKGAVIKLTGELDTAVVVAPEAGWQRAAAKS